MGMDWLFGAESRQPNDWRMRSRTLDIDVVGDVYRMLRDRWAVQVRTVESGASHEPGGDPQNHMAYEAEQRDIQAVRSLEPSIRLVRADWPLYSLAVETAPAIEPDKVPGLGQHERSAIIVSGAGLLVDFRRGVQSTIWAARLDSVDYATSQSIASLIAKSGPPRVRWRHLLRFAPYVLALLVTAAAAWMLVAERSALPTTLFAGSVVVVVWVAAEAARRVLVPRTLSAWPGHRFREVSRSALRDRLTNARATFIVAVVTIPVTAFVTWLVTLVFGSQK